MGWISLLFGTWRAPAYLVWLTFALAFGGGYKLKAMFDDGAAVARLQKEETAQKKAQAETDASARAWETQLTTLRATNQRLNRRLRDELSAAAYTECVVPLTGVQIYNDAVSGSGAGRASGSVH